MMKQELNDSIPDIFFTRKASTLICKKLQGHLPRKQEISAEQSLFVAVIFSAINDLSENSRTLRDSALRYLNGESGDVEYSARLADIDVSYMRLIIKRIARYPYLINKDSEAINSFNKNRHPLYSVSKKGPVFNSRQLVPA